MKFIFTGALVKKLPAIFLGRKQRRTKTTFTDIEHRTIVKDKKLKKQSFFWVLGFVYVCWRLCV